MRGEASRGRRGNDGRLGREGGGEIRKREGMEAREENKGRHFGEGGELR